MAASKNSVTVTVYGRHSELEWKFPARWVICRSCEGHAVTTRHIECDGGGFTASEWEEACGDDPEFANDYFNGRYDRPCPECNGLGRVQELAEEAVTRWRDKIALKAHREQERDFADIDAIQRAEQRMGA